MARKRKEATPHLRIRIEPELLARLEKSRTANNRTLTGEIVHRIEQSLRKSDDTDLATLVYRAAFGERTGDLLRAFATAIWLIEKRTGKKWNEDLETALQVEFALQDIQRAFTRSVWAPFAGQKPAPLDADMALELFKKEHEWSWKNVPNYPKAAKAAALETLQKMGMAPSDAEIEEAAKKRAGSKSEAKGKGQ